MIGYAKLKALTGLCLFVTPALCQADCLGYVDKSTKFREVTEAIECWRSENETAVRKLTESTNATQALSTELDNAKAEATAWRKAAEKAEKEAARSYESNGDLGRLQIENVALRAKYDRLKSENDAALNAGKSQTQFEKHTVTAIATSFKSTTQPFLRSFDAKVQYVDAKLVLTDFSLTVDENDLAFPKLNTDNNYEMHVWMAWWDESKKAYFSATEANVCCYTKTGKGSSRLITNGPLSLEAVDGVALSDQNLVVAITKKGETNYSGSTTSALKTLVK